MATISIANDGDLASNDSIAERVPGGAPELAHVSDDELLSHTRRLVGTSNQLLAALLLHLAEIEARGAHRSRRCASLYTYCIYELRFSEDAAARRSAAARFCEGISAVARGGRGGRAAPYRFVDDWAAPHARESRRRARTREVSNEEGAYQVGS
jgi:hypothetical protein